MKTIFNETDRRELIDRIHKLNGQNQPLWGRMSAYQMLRHCAMWEEMALGKTLYRQVLLGRLFGKFALKDMLKNTPVKRNLPTVKGFNISGTGDVDAEKIKLTELIEEHARCSDPGFLHPFFGKLSNEQGGLLAYKHTDHHLRQFGV